MSGADGHAAGPDIRIATLVGDDTLVSMKFRPHRIEQGLRGSTNFSFVISEAGFPVTYFDVTPNYFRSPRRWNLRKFDLVFNSIADPDSNPKCLSVAAKIEKEYGRPFLNSPRAVLALHRDKVARTAATIPGIYAPKTIRIDRAAPDRLDRTIAAANLRWPAILRTAGRHGGEGTRIVRSSAEVAATVSADETYYLTEFVDYRSKDGLFRKWRFFVIGERVIARDLVIGTQWNLHRADKDKPVPGANPAAEESATIRAFDSARLPAISEMVRTLAHKLRLDFMGLDCCLTSPTSMILFEANPAMDYGAIRSDAARPEGEKRRPLAIDAARRLIWDRVGKGTEQAAG